MVPLSMKTFEIKIAKTKIFDSFEVISPFLTEHHLIKRIQTRIDELLTCICIQRVDAEDFL